MRFRLILLTFACALASALVPLSASAEPRMLDRLPGRPEPPLARRPPGRLRRRREGQRRNRADDRLLVADRREAPGERGQPVRSRVPLRRSRRVRAQRGMHGMEVMLTIWGTPAWANGGKGQNYAPTRVADLQNFAQALASRYSGRFNGYPFVRYYTVWNESNLGQFLSPQYDGGQAGRAADLRVALPRGVRRDQGGQLARARRHRRDLRARPRPAARPGGHPGDRVAGQVRRAALQAAADAPLRRLVAPPVLDHAELAADAEGALAERQPQPAAEVRGVAGALVQPGRADLDHGVRLRDEAGRAEGRQRRRSRPPTCARR